MKGQTEQYKWKVFAAFNNERKYWAKQIKGLMDWLILKKKYKKTIQMKGVMSFWKWKDKLNNMNERSHELLKNERTVKKYK